MLERRRVISRQSLVQLVDRSPQDLPTLFVDLELAFLDDRADELHRALDLIGQGVTDPELRSAALSAAAILATHLGDEALGVDARCNGAE